MMLCGWVFAVYGVWSALDGLLNPLIFACTPPIVRFSQMVSFYLFLGMVALALLNACVLDSRTRTFWSVALYLICLPAYGILQGVLLLNSLLRNASGNLGEWVCTPRMVQDVVGPPGQPLLLKDSAQEKSSNLSRICLLAVGGSTFGSLGGLLIGTLAGRHKVLQPTGVGDWMPLHLWQWVPLCSTTATVYDYGMMAKGLFLGAFAGALLMLLIVLKTHCRRGPGGRLGLSRIESGSNLFDDAEQVAKVRQATV